MSKSKKILPELRFPEFKDSGEWEVKKIEDVLDYERPDNYIVSDTDYQKEGIPVLTANKSFILGYTHEGFGIYENLPAVIFDDFTVDSKYVDFPFKVKSSAIKILTPKKEDNLKFIYELISQIKFDAREHKRYYISEYQQIKIPIPTIQEQQRIASCLSSLDEVIEAHSKKLELLKDHKKGLMQNLFPQDGEKVPKLRFKEFENSGEWEKLKLLNISDVIMGSSPCSEFYNENKIGLPLLQGNADIKNKLSAPRIYTTKITKECEVGDILLSVRAPVGTVAKSLHNACIGRGMSAIRAKKLNSQEYLYQWLFSYELSWGKIAQGGTFEAVNSDDIRNLLVPIPAPPEQQKIASCLSSLDEAIEAQAEKIEQLKLHKKGLMPGLFPKISD